MARIYTSEQYGDNYESSLQSRGFNPIAAIDTSNQEAQRTKQQVANVNREIQINQRDQALESAVLNAQQAVERANLKAQQTTVKGLLALSQTAVKAAKLRFEEQNEAELYQRELDAYYNSPLDGYSLGEISPQAQEAADSAALFSEQQIAIGQATVETAEGDKGLQQELHLPAQKQGITVNVQRQNGYQASQSIGVFLNEFMNSDVVIVRPDGTTFTPRTAETEADLRAADAIAKREFATSAGIEFMNRAVVQRNLIPATARASDAIIRERLQNIRAAQEQEALDNVNGAVIDGVLAGESPVTLFEEAYAGLVGVGGRTKGQASKGALQSVLTAIEENGSMADYDALEKHTLATGHTLGKGATGQLIRDSKDKFLDRIHNDNVRRDRVKTETLNGYKEARYRELIEAGADPDKIRAVEEKYIGLARELGGKDAFAFEKDILSGGTSDSDVAFDLLMDQAQQGQLDEDDVRDAFESGIINTTQHSELSKLVGNEAAELKKAIQPYESDIKRLAKAATEARFGSNENLLGGSRDENAAIEGDIQRRITREAMNFIRLNPEATSGQISQFIESRQQAISTEIENGQKGAEANGVKYQYTFSETPSVNLAKMVYRTSEKTGRRIRDFRGLSTFDFQQANFNNTDDDQTNNFNPVSDIIFNRKELEQYADLYRQGGEAALPDRVKVIAGAIGNMSPRVLLEQQGQAYGINVDLKSYVREQQYKGIPSLAELPTPEKLEQAALDVIGTYESDGVGGYDAVNQYGADDGHSTGKELGMYSGRFSQMSQHGGRELTSLTIQEIMDLQSDDGSMTNTQWRDQGRLHAVGRYQFIGSTLRSLVEKSGIDPNTRFVPQVQDALALYLLRTATSGIGQWVGPKTYASMNEKAIVRHARLLETGNATKAQLVRIAKMFS
jgi:hypothetical protein